VRVDAELHIVVGGLLEIAPRLLDAVQADEVLADRRGDLEVDVGVDQL